MPNRHSGDGAREAREAHNLDISGLDSRPRNQAIALLDLSAWDLRTAGVWPADAAPSFETKAIDPRRQSLPNPLAEELEAGRQDRQDR